VRFLCVDRPVERAARQRDRAKKALRSANLRRPKIRGHKHPIELFPAPPDGARINRSG
jgi:hypothetical protein